MTMTEEELTDQLEELIKGWAKEEGISPAKWLDNLQMKAAMWVDDHPELAGRPTAFADVVEPRVGRAIPNAKKWIGMHPDMSLEEWTAFMLRTFQPQ